MTTRTIKFRAQQSTKEGERGGFVDGFYYETHERPGRTENWIIDKYGHIWLVYSDSLSQFTGLLDKNGKEIFEGDVVEIDRWKTDAAKLNPIREVVKYWSNAFLPVAHGDEKFEVIGNIYENPELLK